MRISGRRFRRWLIGALALAPGLALAQSVPPTKALNLLEYDLDSASYIFPIYCTPSSALSVTACRGTGGAGRKSTQKITTSGSSTTVTSLASNGAFTELLVGDLILIEVPSEATTTPDAQPSQYLRWITARASADSITVNSAVTIPAAGVGFTWWKLSAGTSASSGWFPMNPNQIIVVSVDQMDATSIDYKVECRFKFWDYVSNPIIIAGPTNLTAATDTPDRVAIEGADRYDQCRVGFKINTDDGADTTTHAEKITVIVYGNSFQ